MLSKITIPFSLVLLLSTGAHAQVLAAAPDADLAARQEIRLNVGWASAVGEVGATYSFAPTRWLQLEAGAGYGYSGTQLEAMPRLTLPLGAQARDILSFAAGPSVSFGEQAGERYTAYWLNAEVGYEHRYHNALSLFTALGYTQGMGGKTRGLDLGCFDPPCSDAPTTPEPATDFRGPTFRIGLGYWF